MLLRGICFWLAGEKKRKYILNKDKFCEIYFSPINLLKNAFSGSYSFVLVFSSKSIFLNVSFEHSVSFPCSTNSTPFTPGLVASTINL